MRKVENMTEINLLRWISGWVAIWGQNRRMSPSTNICHKQSWSHSHYRSTSFCEDGFSTNFYAIIPQLENLRWLKESFLISAISNCGEASRLCFFGAGHAGINFFQGSWRILLCPARILLESRVKCVTLPLQFTSFLQYDHQHFSPLVVTVWAFYSYVTV